MKVPSRAHGALEVLWERSRWTGLDWLAMPVGIQQRLTSERPGNNSRNGSGQVCNGVRPVARVFFGVSYRSICTRLDAISNDLLNCRINSPY